MWGITSPLLTNLITVPGPILLSCTYLALKAVTLEISTPPRVWVSKIKTGLIYPSLETFHSTSITLKLATCSSKISLNAKEYLGLDQSEDKFVEELRDDEERYKFKM